MLEQINDDRIEATLLSVLEVTADILLAQLGDERPGCIADNEKRLVALINEVAVVRADLKGQGGGFG
jgi:hypothetical protein